MIEISKCFNGDIKIRFKRYNVHLSNRDAKILRNKLNKLNLGGKRVRSKRG